MPTQLLEPFLPQTLTNYAVIAQGIGSLFILYFVYLQIRQTNLIIKQTKDETDIRLRPWIGVKASPDFDKGSEEEFLKITYRLINYGDSPAISLKTYFNCNSHQDYIFENEPSYENDETLVPNEYTNYNIKISKSKLLNLRNQNSNIFLHVFIKYNYNVSGNEKEGSYEFVEELLSDSSSKRIMTKVR